MEYIQIFFILAPRLLGREILQSDWQLFLFST